MIACVGGGSNAIGIFAAFVDDAGVELIGVEAAGEGIETGRHGAPLTAGGPRRRAARPLSRRSCRTRRARSSRPTRSRPAWTTRARARARPPARHRPGALRGGHRRRRAGGVPPHGASSRGIIPALESSHAIAWVLATPAASSTSSASRAAATRTSPRSWRSRTTVRRGRLSGADRRGVRRDGQARRADALPDGRLPRPGRPRGRSGRPTPTPAPTSIELGVPFSDPLADGPVIHAAAHGGAARRRDRGRSARGRRGARPAASRSWSCATRTSVLAAAWRLPRPRWPTPAPAA